MSTLQIPIHPALANLSQGNQQPESTVRLGGYVGSASQSGVVRLYSALDDLTHYLEFDQSSVVQTAPAAETELPGQGLWIWVKASAPMRWTREYDATSLHDNIRANLALANSSTPPQQS
jgi:hypothetical protein